MTIFIYNTFMVLHRTMEESGTSEIPEWTFNYPSYVGLKGCGAHFMGKHVFPLGCLPSTLCDSHSGCGLQWRCWGVWAEDRVQHHINFSSVAFLYTLTHGYLSSFYVSLYTRLCFPSFYPPSSSPISAFTIILLITLHLCRLTCASRIKLLMLFYDA